MKILVDNTQHTLDIAIRAENSILKYKNFSEIFRANRRTIVSRKSKTQTTKCTKYMCKMKFRGSFLYHSK